jgi:hypothetical protein
MRRYWLNQLYMTGVRNKLLFRAINTTHGVETEA